MCPKQVHEGSYDDLHVPKCGHDRFGEPTINTSIRGQIFPANCGFAPTLQVLHALSGSARHELLLVVCACFLRRRLVFPQFRFSSEKKPTFATTKRLNLSLKHLKYGFKRYWRLNSTSSIKVLGLGTIIAVLVVVVVLLLLLALVALVLALVLAALLFDHRVLGRLVRVRVREGLFKSGLGLGLG
jgi:hypothetical protein